MLSIYWDYVNARYLGQKGQGMVEYAVILAMLASFFGFIQGMSLLQCLFNHLGMSRLMRTVIIIVVFLGGVLWQIVAFTGLFDMALM